MQDSLTLYALLQAKGRQGHLHSWWTTKNHILEVGPGMGPLTRTEQQTRGIYMGPLCPKSINHHDKQAQVAPFLCKERWNRESSTPTVQG